MTRLGARARSFIVRATPLALALGLAGCPPRAGLDGGGGSDASFPACSNGLDDDGDLATDFPNDIGCVDGADDDESNPPACMDGLDNDSDGAIDYPADPGCTSDSDSDETNPECSDGIDNDGDGDTDFPDDADCVGPGDLSETPAPECSNALDDNGDALIDFPADPGCTDASDDNESGAPDCPGGIPVDEITYTGMVSGTTEGTSLTEGLCGGAGAPEAFAWVNVPVQLETLSINTFGTTFANLVYVESICADSSTSLGCATAVLGAGGTVQTPALLELSNVGPGGYFIGVDGMTAGAAGPYYVRVFGLIAAGQPCDPADTVFICNSSLNYDCVEPLPGFGTVCVAGLCSDGLDNDSDGLVDWPLEPGCEDIYDNDETNPPVAPQCWNTIDDDGDALSDYPADPGCEDSADDLELDQCVPGLLVNNLPATGNVLGTVSGTSYLDVECDTSWMGSGPEAAWLITVPAVADLTVSTANPGTTFNTNLAIRDECELGSSEVACASSFSTGETITATDLTPGSYFILVEGQDAAAGSYELSVSGSISAGQPCDPAWLRFSCETTTACEPGPGPTGMVCTLADCADGADNDGDALADYPPDPGCTSLSDPSEVDPPVLPQCANGIDDDGDALVDWPEDTGCTAASDDDETCSVFDGPDGYGYVGCEEFPAVMPCEDTSGTGTAVSLSDDSSVSVPLPFTFDYYGVGRTSVSIISNGKLGFPGTTSYTNSCTIETDTIALWWDDLYPPSGGTVTYQTFGTAPNRHFTVTYHLPHIGGTWPNIVDVRAMLFEGSNHITVCYVDTDLGSASYSFGASATVGIHGATAANTVDYSCNTTALSDGLVLQYLHP